MSGGNGTSGPDWPQRYGVVDVGFMFTAALCLAFIALLAFTIHLYVRHLIARDSQQRAAVTIFHAAVGAEGGAAPALDQSALARMPTFVYMKGDSSLHAGDAIAAECAICLSVAEEGEAMRLLPDCKHVFHVVCIDKWFRFNSTCPVCRAGVVAPEGSAVGAVGAEPSQVLGPLLPDQLRSDNVPSALDIHER